MAEKNSIIEGGFEDAIESNKSTGSGKDKVTSQNGITIVFDGGMHSQSDFSYLHHTLATSTSISSSKPAYQPPK